MQDFLLSGGKDTVLKMSVTPPPPGVSLLQAVPILFPTRDQYVSVKKAKNHKKKVNIMHI